MGDRGPSKRITMADFFNPPTLKQQPPPPATTTTVDKNSNYSMTNDEQRRAKPPQSLYTIRATKKGGVPCVVESRKHHKVVVLSNVEGDVPALLSALQKSLGTGGVRKGNSIEIQGEHHLEKVQKFCLNSGCVVGASKQNKAEAAAAVASGKKITGKKQIGTKSDVKDTGKPQIDGTTVSVKEIKTMKPTQLKEHLAARQLSTQGNKKELLARLLLSVHKK